MKIDQATLNKIRFYLRDNINLKEFLDEEEYRYVREKKQDEYIQDKLVEYNPSPVYQSFRIQKVLTERLDLVEWFESILELLTPIFKVSIDLGYFIVRPEKENTLSFSFPSKTNSFFKYTIKSAEDFNDCLNRFEKMEPDLITHAFENDRLRNETFNESGYIPVKPAVLHIYLTKF